MAYDENLAERIREYFNTISRYDMVEKKMFGGLAFLVDDKMCVNVSKNRLMCRFDKNDQEELQSRPGFEQMIMKGRVYNGYCYVHEEGYDREDDFVFWMETCLAFNKKAKSSKKKP